MDSQKKHDTLYQGAFGLELELKSKIDNFFIILERLYIAILNKSEVCPDCIASCLCSYGLHFKKGNNNNNNNKNNKRGGRACCIWINE